MKIRGKRAKINIWTSNGTQSAPGIVFGPYLALHKKWSKANLPMRGWTITHIPTGLKILAADNQQQGRKFIKELLELDWTRPDYKTALASLVRHIHRNRYRKETER